MDPLSALGVAAAAVQFIDFSLQTIAVCRQIHEDGSGATKQNRELEEHAHSIRSMRNELQKETTSATPAGKQVKEEVKKCIEAANDLLELLARVRSKEKANVLSSIAATFRATKERHRIERLHGVLKERQDGLDSALLQDLRDHAQLTAVAQEKQYSSLDEKIRALLKSLESQQTVQSSQHRVVTHGIAGIQRRLDDLTVRDLATSLLDSLFYAEITTRQENIKPPFQDTFKWILEKGHTSGWSSLPDWLETETGIYWITGKAGSGKSTLLAHVASEERTVAYLETWADKHTLQTVKFFFWRAGSPLQRSVKGLLRSILYQLIDGVPVAGEHAVAELRFQPGRVHDWTESRLNAVLKSVLERVMRERRVCFFIDGLDEYDGDLDEVMDAVSTLASFPNAKACVSSRPEIQLRHRLASCPGLKMERLNYDDIRTFVMTKLEPYKRQTDLSWPIYSAADGVFLWAALVTASTVRGILAGDTDDDLKRKLEKTPREVEALLRDLWSKVDGGDAKSLSLYFNALRLHELGLLARSPALAAVTAAQLNEDITCYSTFVRTCDLTKAQIVARSCGLIEVEDGFYSRYVQGEYSWALGFGTAAEPYKRSREQLNRKSLVESRVYSLSNPVTLALMKRESLTASWYHRSAYDFVLSTGLAGPGSELEARRLGETMIRLLEGKMRLLVSAPSTDLVSRATYQRISDIINDAAVVNSMLGGDTAFHVLDELLHLVQFFQTEELIQNDLEQRGNTEDDFSLCSPMIPSRTFGPAFIWAKCVEVGLLSYVQCRIEAMSCQEDGGWTFARVIYACCQESSNHDEYDRVHEALAEHGLQKSHLTREKYETELEGLLTHLLNALLLKLTELPDAVKPRPLCTGHWRAQAKSWLALSWSGLSESLSSIYEREVVQILSVSFWRWAESGFRPWARENHASDAPEHPLASGYNLSELWRQVLGRWDVYLDERDHKRKYINSQRLHLQHTADWTFRMAFACANCAAKGKLCLQDVSPDKVTARIICKGEDVDVDSDDISRAQSVASDSVVIFQMGDSMQPYLDTAFTNLTIDETTVEDFDHDELLEKSGFWDALMEDVRLDVGEQLSAWQQLFVLASIRYDRSRRARWGSWS